MEKSLLKKKKKLTEYDDYLHILNFEALATWFKVCFPLGLCLNVNNCNVKGWR